MFTMDGCQPPQCSNGSPSWYAILLLHERVLLQGQQIAIAGDSQVFASVQCLVKESGYRVQELHFNGKTSLPSIPSSQTEKAGGGTLQRRTCFFGTASALIELSNQLLHIAVVIIYAPELLEISTLHKLMATLQDRQIAVIQYHTR